MLQYNHEYVMGRNDRTGSYMFVDGASLVQAAEAFVAEHIGPDIRPEIAFQRMADWYEKVFYYDAVPVTNESSPDSDKSKAETSRALLSAIDGMPKYHVFEGEARRRRGKGLEQKQVDVRIAVDMMTHAFRRNMRICSLVTGDSDFIPLVEALVREGIFVEIHYPLGCTSERLLRSASSRLPLDKERFYYLLANNFKTEHGVTIESLGLPERKLRGVYIQQ